MKALTYFTLASLLLTMLACSSQDRTELKPFSNQPELEANVALESKDLIPSVDETGPLSQLLNPDPNDKAIYYEVIDRYTTSQNDIPVTKHYSVIMYVSSQNPWLIVLQGLQKNVRLMLPGKKNRWPHL